MAQSQEFTLSPAFQAVASTGIDLPSLLDSSPHVSRKPRLLVPIDVQVMRVRSNEAVEHADVSTAAVLDSALDGDAPEAAPPAPFTEGDKRRPGMYIHWAVPDALTRGDVEVDDEGELRPGSEASFPVLPNRWALTRFWFDSKADKFAEKTVVIEADRGRVVALEEWEEALELPDRASARTPDVAPQDLTAVMGGDPAWFAVFDNVEDRFAYFDDLADLGGFSGSIGYAVAGWYSDRTLDPLGGLALRSALDTLLEEYAWTADLSGLEAAAVRSQTSIEQFSRIALATRQPVSVDKTNLGSDWVAPSMLGGAGEVVVRPQPYWPEQSLYHGVAYDIAVAANSADAKPAPSLVEVGLGTTGTEGLSALMAESAVEAREAADEVLLNALQYGVLSSLEDASGLARLGEELHQRAFESQPGGWTTEQIRDGDPFAHLRTPLGKSKFDVFTRAVGTVDLGPLEKGAVFETVAADPFQMAEQHFLKRVIDQGTGPPQDVATIAGSGSGPKGTFQAPTTQFGFSTALGSVRTNIIGPSELLKAEDRELIDRRLVDPNRVVRPDPKKGLTFRQVRRALPRLFYPQDPVVTMRGLNRSQRHQEDGRYDDEGRLLCRLSGDTVTRFVDVVEGRDLLVRPLRSGAIPLEVAALLHEALLQAPDATDRLVRMARTSAASAVAADNLSVRMKAEERFFVRSLDPTSTAGELAPQSIREGKMASPVATTIWQQPWVPMYLEWEVSASLDESMQPWRLGELDLEHTGKGGDTVARQISGRSLLSKAGTTSVAELLAETIDEEEKLDEIDRVLSQAQLNRLAELNKAAGVADVLGASLEGFRDYLLGIRSNVRFTPEGEEGELLPDAIPDLLRAGVVTIKALRVVDAFGRYVDLTAPFSVADTLEVPTEDGESGDSFRLPPRIVPPSRLWFRFVDATDDRVDAALHQGEADEIDLTRSPVAAWLLPDHVDHALEFFDDLGEPLGQLRNERLGRGVAWEGAPGRPGPMGRPPVADIPNRHAAELARAMVQRDAAERQAETGQKESTLDAFLRVVDTTLWTVDPFADSGLDYYAKMTGRPIAVVRARLLLDVVTDYEVFAEGSPERADRKAAFDELSRRRFEVRLGALTRVDDGLLGYFVNDDYWHFHPVHASIPSHALPSGPHRGYLDAQVNVEEFDQAKPVQPIEHPYVVSDPTVEVQVGHPVMLTMLMDPGTRVHATSGILPRKSISLPRGFVEDALVRIAPSFRFGPVLVDPTVIRMPKPSVLPTEQVWTRRDTPTSWRDDPIEAATQFAYLPETSAEAQEGYIRVRIDADSDE